MNSSDQNRFVTDVISHIFGCHYCKAVTLHFDTDPSFMVSLFYEESIKLPSAQHMIYNIILYKHVEKLCGVST